MTKPFYEKVLRGALLPLIRRQAERLRKKETPRGVANEVDLILSALEAAVHTAEAKPSRVIGNPNSSPFARPRKMAERFGFTICALY